MSTPDVGFSISRRTYPSWSANVSGWLLLNANRYPPCPVQMYAVSSRFRETLRVLLWDRYYPSLSRCRWYINVQWAGPTWISLHFWVFLCVSASFVSSTRLTMLISVNRNAEILPLWSSLSQSRIFTEANHYGSIYGCRSKGPCRDCPLQRPPGFQH